MAVVCASYFKGWFFGRGSRERRWAWGGWKGSPRKRYGKDRSGKETEQRQGSSEGGGGWGVGRAGRALPAMQSREKHRTGGSSNPRRPTSAIYWLSQPPDKGGQPRSIRGHPPTYPSILCPTPEPRCILSTQLTLPHEAFSTNLASCPCSDSANDPPSLKIYTPEQRVTLNPSQLSRLCSRSSTSPLCTLSLFLQRRTPRCNALMKIYERNLPSWKFVYPGGSRADEGGWNLGFQIYTENFREYSMHLASLRSRYPRCLCKYTHFQHVWK